MNAPLMGDERGGLGAFLQHQREAVLNAVYGLREDQARVAPTTSSLTLGGVVKHLAYGETNYADLIEGKPPADQADAYAQYMATFVLGGDETCRARYRGTGTPPNAPTPSFRPATTSAGTFRCLPPPGTRSSARCGGSPCT